MLAGQAALLRGGAGLRAHVFAEAGEVVLAVEHQDKGLLVGEHILAEGGAEFGEPFANLGQPAGAPLAAARRRRGGR